MRARTITNFGLLLAALALHACTDPLAPPSKRVLVENERLGVNPAGPMRASERRIALEEREAYTELATKPLELALAAQGRAHLETAAALIAPEGAELPAETKVEFHVAWKDAVAGGVLEQVQTTDAASAGRTWTPLLVRAGEPKDVSVAPRLERRSTVTLRVTASAALPPGTRVAWAVPAVREYFEAPLSNPLSSAERARPNVLFVSFDSLRADHVGCYGYPRATTPHVDALAKQGVLFEDAISCAPWTLPSYGSVFTGLLPGRHCAGLIQERQEKYGTDDPCELKGPAGQSHPLREGIPTLASLLAASGWRTAQFSNNGFLHPTYGVTRGFQRVVSYQYNALEGVELARAWIAEQDRPWFCFLHVMDPHMPYAPPAPWDRKFREQGLDDMPGWPPALKDVQKIEGVPDEAFRQAMTDFYDGDIAFADDQVGRLLDELEARGVLKNTIVVFHSDHGEELWDHGGFEHGHALHGELLHVPLVVRFDGKLPAGTRVKGRVRAFDLFPTLLELAGVAVPGGIDAESLLSEIRANAPLPPRDVTAEFLLYGKHEAKARYVGGEKLIATKRAEDQVFDVATDPAETRDLAAERAEFVKRERAVLDAHRARTLKELPPPPKPLSEKDRERQRADGYGGAGDDEGGATKKPR